MTPSLFLSLLSGLALANAQAPSIDDYSEADIANGQAWADIVAIADRKIQSNLASRPDAVCTYANAEIRSEWRTLSSDTRQSFTDAVLCLQDLPPQVMTTVEAPSYPGIQTRYEEYVATHINYTLSIHGTADFFEWHRTFTHFFYRDLRDRCGYQGPMPYWDWSRDAAAPQDSELFSGDAASMGSNGVFIPDRPDTWLALQGVTYPPGTGGGCVTEGPFSNMTVRLGPLDTPNTPNVPTPFAANPRCLVRDLNPWFSSQYNTYENVTRLVLESIFVEDLQDRAEGFAPGDKFGVHGGGHWQVGGPMADFHSSPGDPIFFLHHAQIDRIFTTWQNLDIGQRQFVIRGTSTLENSPPSPEMTLDDQIPFGFVAPSQTFRDLMDTFAGPFCYRYE